MHSGWQQKAHPESPSAWRKKHPGPAHLVTVPYLEHSSPTSPSSWASTSPGPTCGLEGAGGAACEAQEQQCRRSDA